MKPTLKALTAVTLIFLVMQSFAQGIVQYVAKLALANPHQDITAATKNHYKIFQPPQINNGDVVFQGKTLTNKPGIYANIKGFLRAIADNQTPVPFGVGNFTSFTNLSDFGNNSDIYTTSINRSKVAFLGTDANWDTAIYSFTPSTDIQLVANQKTPIPDGKGDFIGFAFPTALVNGGVMFWGKGQSDQEGLYKANNKGLLKQLINTTVDIPNGEGTFQHFTDVSVSKDRKIPNSFAFIGTGSTKQTGIYLAENSKVKTIVNDQTQIPGKEVGYFTRFSDLSYDATNNELSFIGYGILGQQGVFYYDSSKVVAAVTQRNIPPSKLGNFETFSYPNIQGKYIVFQATGAYNLEGIYLYKIGGDIYKIISNHDEINKKHILHVTVSNNAFSGNQVAVLVKFTNGTSGIYVIALKLA